MADEAKAEQQDLALTILQRSVSSGTQRLTDECIVSLVRQTSYEPLPRVLSLRRARSTGSTAAKLSPKPPLSRAVSTPVVPSPSNDVSTSGEISDDQFLAGPAETSESSPPPPAEKQEEATPAKDDPTPEEAGDANARLDGDGIEEKAVECVEQDTDCSVCYGDLDGTVKPCRNPQCSAQFCSGCQLQYFQNIIEGSRYYCAQMKCPGCLERIKTPYWRKAVPAELWSKYLRNAKDILMLRCYYCDAPSSRFVAAVDEGPEKEAITEAVLADLPSENARRKMARITAEYRRAELEPEELVEAMVKTFRPQGFRLLSKHMEERIPSLLRDVERRASLQMSWLRRYPFVETLCCQRAMCFKCKVRDHHQGRTCAEVQAAEIAGGVQFCPGCNVPTVRSEGCTHIICVCGYEWYWEGGDY